MKFYYIPLCSKDYTFENIFSTESVSPPLFYSQRRFGIDYFYSVPELSASSSIVLFTSPPVFTISKEHGDIQKFVLAVSEELLDINILDAFTDGVFLYSKTIYLRRSKFKILFFSERDKRLSLLRAETSLPTKGLKKYLTDINIISENDCERFVLSTKKLNEIVTSDSTHEIQRDRNFNNFKGFLYGLTIGLLDKQPGPQTVLRRELKYILELFATFKNRLESISPKSYDKSSLKEVSIFFEKTKTAIGKLKAEFTNLYPSEFSEEKFADFLHKSSNHFKDINDASQYLRYKKIDENLFGNKEYDLLKQDYIKSASIKSPESYFDILDKNLKYFSETITQKTVKPNKEELEDNFKTAIFNLQQLINDWGIKDKSQITISLKGLDFNITSNDIYIDSNFSTVEKIYVTDFLQVANILVKNPKSYKGETSISDLLQIVTTVEENFTNKKGGKSSQLYQYLNNEVNSYSLDKVSSLVMKNFVAFIFNPDSIEKLVNFIEAKDIQNSWIAYSFWGAFNGFANMSGNFLAPIFSSDKVDFQNSLDTFLFMILNQSQEITNSEKQLQRKEERKENDASTQLEKVYEQLSKKLEVPIEDLKHLFKEQNETQFYATLKTKFKILKKDSQKIYKSLIEASNLSLF